MKSILGGVLLLVKLQAKTCNFLKVTLLYGCFSRFLNCTNGTKLRKAYCIVNPLSANPIRCSNTLKQFVLTYCLSVFDHFVGLVLKWLNDMKLN